MRRGPLRRRRMRRRCRRFRNLRAVLTLRDGAVSIGESSVLRGINRMPLQRRRFLLSLAGLTTSALRWPAPARAADSTKTLRVALSIAETSFDPAFASDAASDAI